ncbi:MAG: hypothetical protein DRO00_08700 [Thermoproteota archaeon]|nr:MAG: hypothetical protein DRO00_08700 [Candidatus Korarchaeota archaeon]
MESGLGVLRDPRSKTCLKNKKNNLEEILVEIRRLVPDDYEKMIRLWEEAGLPYKPKGRDSRESIEKQMKENPDFVIGAFDGERLIGTIIASFDGRKGWINRLAVHPEYRRRGIGQLLIRKAETVFKEKGAWVICALIERENKPSLNLFEKCGYKPSNDIVYVSKRESDLV